MSSFEDGIIDDQAGIYFRSTPTCLRKRPFEVENDWDRTENVFANIEVLRSQLGVQIDDLRGSRKKNRHSLVLDPDEDRTFTRRNDVRSPIIRPVHCNNR